MKCDHLIGRVLDNGDIYVLAADVMEAITELKEKLESVQASAYADSVDAGMRERRATNRELARWLAKGNGELCNEADDSVLTTHSYEYDVDNPQKHDNDEVWDALYVRRWSDTEWHEPTVDYLFGGDE